MARFLRSVIGVLVLLLGVAALPHLGLPNQPSRVSLSQPTATPTVTPTPEPGEIVMTGQVYDGRFGLTRGIGGATVAVYMSVPHSPFQTRTDADGFYRLVLPALYTARVNEIRVWADCFATLVLPISASELRARPECNFALWPSRECDVFLPIIICKRVLD